MRQHLLTLAMSAGLVLGVLPQAGSNPAAAATQPPDGDLAAAPAAPQRAVSFGYGFQVDPNNDYGRALGVTREAGFGWAKVQVRWADMEPEPGNINWGALDAMVGGARDAGVGLILSIATSPEWARPGQDLTYHGPPTDPSTYANFVGAIASRYPGGVNAYEVWNEQNLGREWGGPGRQDPYAYVALLRAAYNAIKEADSDATVLLGALTPAGTVDLGEGALAVDDVEYLQSLYDAGARRYFDAVAAHPSGFNSSPLADPSDPATLGRDGGFRGHRSFYFRNFEYYRRVMVRNGDAAKQLWFTEFGWASGEAGDEWGYSSQNSEDDQATWLVQAFEYGRSTGYIGVMCVWNLNFSGSDEGKRAFAVLNPDWSPRPAYSALAAMPK